MLRAKLDAMVGRIAIFAFVSAGLAASVMLIRHLGAGQTCGASLKFAAAPWSFGVPHHFGFLDWRLIECLNVFTRTRLSYVTELKCSKNQLLNISGSLVEG